jgi:hypothetical protein
LERGERISFLDGEQATVLPYGVAVRHAGEVVGNGPHAVALELLVEVRRRQARLW